MAMTGSAVRALLALALAAFGETSAFPRSSPEHAGSNATGAEVDRQDGTITQLIKSMTFCFLEGDETTSGQDFAFGWGRLYISHVCCRDTVIAGLDVQLDPQGNQSLQWGGDTTLSASLQNLATDCDAKWVWLPDAWMPLDTKHTGTFSMHVAGREVYPPPPFGGMAVHFAGNPITSGGVLYPFLGNATIRSCTINLEVTDLKFHGWASSLLNLTGTLAPMIEALLHPLVCMGVRSQVPPKINDAVAQFRGIASEFMSSLPPPLDMPAAPRGASETTNLNQSKLFRTVQRLLEQGLETGDLSKLIRKATAGTGSTAAAFPKGVPLADLRVDQTTTMNMSVFFEGGGIEGVTTIGHLGLVAFNDTGMSLDLVQDKLAVSAAFRTETAVPSTGVDAPETMNSFARRLRDTLSERFKMRLSLSQLRVAVQMGMLLDDEQVNYLSQGTGWYSQECMPGMVQNMSAMDIDVQVVVDEFRWVSNFTNPSALEVEFDRSVNNILGYLNAPGMRPTVSRLVRTIAAGQVRDTMNEQMAAFLASPPAQPCEPHFGIGSLPVYATFAVLGGLLASAAVCLPAGARFFLRRKLSSERVSLLLAFAASLLMLGGLLGFPLRAVIRLHNGGKDEPFSGDSILNMFIPDIAEPMEQIPATVALLTLQSMFGALRLGALMAALQVGFTPRISSGIRRLAAVGAWDLGLVFYVAATQICGFYSRIVHFGDTYVDMGAVVSPGFYCFALGNYLCDFATLLVYSKCSRQKGLLDVDAEQQQQQQQPPDQAKPPQYALCGLAAALLLLLVAPWLNLWTFTYDGLFGRMLHFQSDSLVRPLSLAGLLSRSGELINPGPLGIGSAAMCVLLIVHVLAAPLAHCVLALYVGLRLRSSDVSVSADAADGNAAFSCSMQRALVAARMWSGADAFAVSMWIFVPELGAELVMLSKQSCDPMAAMLEKIGEQCNVVYSALDAPGLPVLLLGGLLARVCADLCAHHPLHRLKVGRRRRGQSLQLSDPMH